jgi:hypothetical protein
MLKKTMYVRIRVEFDRGIIENNGTELFAIELDNQAYNKWDWTVNNLRSLRDALDQFLNELQRENMYKEEREIL